MFRFAFDDQIFRELLENELNDANLNPGFNLEAFRDAQLQLHNYYRSLHGAPLMSRDEEYVLIFHVSIRWNDNKYKRME